MAGTFKRFRSAVSGKFITAAEAAKHPATTVSETTKRIARKLKPKK